MTNSVSDGCGDERETDWLSMANAIRFLSMDAVQQANSGHPGMPMGMADVATVLFNKFMRVDPGNPEWPDRDRFVLSAGHGSMLLYSIHHLLGYHDMGIEELRGFRQLGRKTAGHPEYRHAAGIEMTTGPLGQGLASAVGMAIAERALRARFGSDLVDHHTYVICGDGCLMEGISHEAIDIAGHLGLDRLLLLWDDNGITIDGSTDLSTSCDQLARFRSHGWHVDRVDGHNPIAIEQAIEAAKADTRPSLIACKTIIGFGAPNKQGTSATHGAALGHEEIAAAREQLNWPYPPFEIPAEIIEWWSEPARRGSLERAAWEARLECHPKKAQFEAASARQLPAGLSRSILDLKEKIRTEIPKVATRKASETTLSVIHRELSTLMGGSADLTGSNNTRVASMKPITRDDFSGDYIHYGIREHAMAAAMNGMAAHGGLVPFGGTFLVFSDYARPAIRLSALMELPVIYVMTHDSIGLGEDGPTHQPVEHLAALRAIPNLDVFRPSDAVETAEAWECALRSTRTPSLLCLSRQALPTLRTGCEEENRTARGGYVLQVADNPRDLTLIATGSEVALAQEAANALKVKGKNVAVVSLPCFERFACQTPEYRAQVLGTAPRLAVEAAISQGWERWIGGMGKFIGMDTFGASAPAEDLYQHFGITLERVVEAGAALIDPEIANGCTG